MGYSGTITNSSEKFLLETLDSAKQFLICFCTRGVILASGLATMAMMGEKFHFNETPLKLKPTRRMLYRNQQDVCFKASKVSPQNKAHALCHY
jgi:hypothetical protein